MMNEKPKSRSRATELVGRWAFRIAAFEFGFVVLQAMTFEYGWLGADPVIPAAFLLITDALMLSLTGLFTIIAIAAQVAGRNVMWHPIGGLTLVVGAVLIAINVFHGVFGD
jgi:hypothetical protein